jgi:hypothetical protein
VCLISLALIEMAPHLAWITSSGKRAWRDVVQRSDQVAVIPAIA